MNPIFQQLLKKTNAIKPFINWYNSKYPNGLATFQNLPFSHQIGVYLEYFETIYTLVILVNTHGYTIHFTDDRKAPLYGENGTMYNHYKYKHSEPKSILYGYELGILWMFDNYDLPF